MNIKSKNRLVFALAIALFFWNCSNDKEDDVFDPTSEGLGIGTSVDKCLDLGEDQLVLSIQEKFTTLPSKISIFFKVSDTNGNPVADLTANKFTIYEQGRNDECFNTISTSESMSRISPNSQIFSDNTLLVLDLSNSVLSSSLDELKTASKSFIDRVIPVTVQESKKMAIYWFDGENELHLLNPFTASRQELVSAINSITNDINNDPSTDLYGAVIKATDIADGLLRESNKNRIIAAASIVIFTDGTDQASRFTEDAALKKVTDANPNISFFSIGLGAEIDIEVLSEIGKTFSVFAGNKAELENVFTDISARVSQLANSFYLFEYCSPKRDGSGENNLVIQIKEGSRQGAVQTKFNTNGFTGGCK